LTAATLSESSSAMSSSEWSSTSFRITHARCAGASARKLDSAACTACRRAVACSGSSAASAATSSAASSGSVARNDSRRQRSIARWCAIRNSHGRSGGSSVMCESSKQARASVSWTTSSPSATEPVMRAQ